MTKSKDVSSQKLVSIWRIMETLTATVYTVVLHQQLKYNQ